MGKLNSSTQAPKGVRLRWTSLKEVTAVRLSSDVIRGTRSSSNGKFITRDSQSGRFVEKTSARNHDDNPNGNFLIP